MIEKRGKKTVKIRVIVIVALAFTILLLMIFGSHPMAVERYYTKGLYPVVCHVLHPVLNLFPFSVGDIVYILVIFYIGYAVIRLIYLGLKKQFKRAGIFLMGLLIALQTAILVFYIFWGMNYYRPPAGELFDLRDSIYTTAELKAVTARLIDSANACRSRVTPADLLQSNAVIYKTAVKSVLKLSTDSVRFHTYSPRVKPSLLTPLLNYIGTSGYYNPFTGEAQLNYQMPVFERPVTACHEMSHQMGFGTEAEAN